VHLVAAASMTSAPGSVRVKSSQKYLSKMPTDLNVNDLLNFTLPPRQQRPIASTPRRSRRTGTSQSVWNKERQYFHFVEIYDYDLNHPGFVNAQYRFVMNPTGDYTAHFADPDMFVSICYSRLCGRLSLVTDSFNGMTFFRSSYREPLPCSLRLTGCLPSKMTSCRVPFVYPPRRHLESPNAAMSVSNFRFYILSHPCPGLLLSVHSALPEHFRE